jgi:hypothetical protein
MFDKATALKRKLRLREPLLSSNMTHFLVLGMKTDSKNSAGGEKQLLQHEFKVQRRACA